MLEPSEGNNSEFSEEELKESRKATCLEVIVLMCALYAPSFLAQFSGFSSPQMRLSTSGGMFYRIVAEAAHLAVIVYVVFGLRRSAPIWKLKFDLKWDIASGVLLFCFDRAIWIATYSIATGKTARFAITLHS